MPGITKDGFIPKTLRDIRGDLIANCALIKDTDTGEYPLFNICDDTVLSQVIGVFASELSVAWAELGEVYAQFDPQMNTGAGQSGTVQLNAIIRKEGAYSKIDITVGGVSGTVVPKGSLIGNMQGTLSFSVDEDITLVGDEGATVTAKGSASATKMGPLNPQVNSIIAIQTPTNGWNTVTNTATTTVGTEEETDAALRKRQQRSTSLTSYRQIDAIWAALVNLEGVTYARVYQNSDTYPEDDRGIPYKEVAAIVEGGKDEKIAEALFYRLPTGQIGYGTTSVDFTDAQNILYSISFSRPKKIPVYVQMTLKIYDSGEWPADGADKIKQAIIDYARYDSEMPDMGFPPGTDVILSRLYTPINTVPGHSVTKLEIGLDGKQWTEQDMHIRWNELAVFDAERITVNIEQG